MLMYTDRLAEAVSEIEQRGGRLAMRLAAGVIVVELPGDVNPAELQHSIVTPRRALEPDEQQAVKAWQIATTPEPKRPPRRGEGLSWDAPGFTAPRNPGNDDELARRERERRAARPPGTPPTSEYLIGSVAVAILCVSGTLPTLQLSSDEQLKVRSEVFRACEFLRAEEPRARLTFAVSYRTVTVNATPCSSPVQDSYEACEAPWRDAALAQLGYASGEAGLDAYAEAVRTEENTEWVVVALFTKYPLHHFAYALAPRTCMEYSNDLWGPDNIDRLFAHELTHLFGAADEYAASGCGCAPSGFLHVPNMNCVNCTERSPHQRCLLDQNDWSICNWSRGQLGWYPALLDGLMVLHQSYSSATTSYATLDIVLSSDDVPVQGWQTSGPPGVAVYRRVLYCAHQTANSAGWLALTTFNGSSWSKDEEIKTAGGGRVGLSASPALAVFNDKLYCLHQGRDNDGWVYWTVFDGASWSKDEQVKTAGGGRVGLSASPALAVFNGKLYCLHQGRDSDGWLYWTVFDGSSWSKDEQVKTFGDGRVGLSGSPALAAYSDGHSPSLLYCVHRGRGGEHWLYKTSFDGSTWAQDAKLITAAGALGIEDSPALAVDGRMMFCVYRSQDNKGCFTVFTGGRWWREKTTITKMVLTSSPAAIGGLQWLGDAKPASSVLRP